MPIDLTWLGHASWLVETAAWAERVRQETSAEATVLKPGEKFSW